MTGTLDTPDPRLDFAVSKAVGIPLEMRNVPYATLLPVLAPYLDDRPGPGYGAGQQRTSRKTEKS